MIEHLRSVKLTAAGFRDRNGLLELRLLDASEFLRAGELVVILAGYERNRRLMAEKVLLRSMAGSAAATELAEDDGSVPAADLAHARDAALSFVAEEEVSATLDRFHLIARARSQCDFKMRFSPSLSVCAAGGISMPRPSHRSGMKSARNRVMSRGSVS